MTEIIVTDDERSMREFLEILLSKEGYAVRCAPGMSKALALMDEQVPDVVITDLKMKGGSGLDLLKDIRALNAGEEPARKPKTPAREHP